MKKAIIIILFLSYLNSFAIELEGPDHYHGPSDTDFFLSWLSDWSALIIIVILVIGFYLLIRRSKKSK
jgi:hypothetical protein